MENEVTTTSDIPKTPEGIKGWLGSVFIATSQTVVGQTLFKMVDSFLWNVEKSAQWSLPAQEIEDEDKGKVFGKMKLVRPLPWLIFLPGLLILRIIRCTINVGAYIFGYPQIQPITMVRFVQRSRRRLRALNLKIARSMRRSPSSKVTTPDEKSTTESVDSPIQHEAKRKFSQISSDEENIDGSDGETLEVKLGRLAMEDSADDLDFNLATCSTGINTASSSVSSDEADKDVSLTELRDIQKEANEFLQNVAMLTSSETVMPNLEKLEDTLDGDKYGVDSSVSERRKPICTCKQFIDHEVTSTSEQLPIDQISSPQETDEMFMRSQNEPATCELPPAPESCELPPAQESCELPPAQESCELPPAPKFRESPPAPKFREIPSGQESCELPPASESRELPPAPEPRELSPMPESRELLPVQKSCELLSTADSCELQPESCGLPPNRESCESTPTPKSCELPPVPESCELPSALESCELPPVPESCELPPSQIPCELTPAPETCTSAEAHTLDTKEFPIVQEKDHKPEKLEHHRDTN